MSIKKRIFICFLLWNLTFTYSQSQEQVYLLFNKDSLAVCEISMYRDGHDKKKFNYTYEKVLLKNRVLFMFCKQTFEFYPEKNIIEEIDNLNGLPLIGIDDLLIKIETDWPKTSKDTFDIFVLEKNNSGMYYKYKVKWI